MKIYFDNSSIHNWLVREHGLKDSALTVYISAAGRLAASYVDNIPDHTEVALDTPMFFDYFGIPLEVDVWKPKQLIEAKRAAEKAAP